MPLLGGGQGNKIPPYYVIRM